MKHHIHPFIDSLSKLITSPPNAIRWKLKKLGWQLVQRMVLFLGSNLLIKKFIRVPVISAVLYHKITCKETYPILFSVIQNKEWLKKQFGLLFPGEEESVTKAAIWTCQHQFFLFGSRISSSGNFVDWQLDFKSGHRWDGASFFANLKPAPYPGGYDIKVPWELSRCQHFLFLGEAYCLTQKDVYANEFKAEILDWIAKNPYLRGVNWACAMDVAIRAINWLLAYNLFEGCELFNEEFKFTLLKSLFQHGCYIINNLERYDTFNSNHYLSDLVGLVFLGEFLKGTKETDHWRKFGVAELEKEILNQVYPDGVDFEASTSYHRLVTEIFLFAAILGQKGGFPFSAAYLNQLEKMLEFILCITQPDGTVPLIGDNDNGRLFRLKVWEPPEREWVDFRYLLAMGAVFFDRLDFARAAGDQWEEALWFFGEKALEVKTKAAQNQQPALASRAFTDGGIYVIRDQQNCMIIDAGPPGQNGNGGHAHNDGMSFVLQTGGVSWIVDPGTFTYTQDYEVRHLFRSIAFHNTVQPGDFEQNISSSRTPFGIQDAGTISVSKWDVGSDIIIFTGQCIYPQFTRIIHKRTIGYCCQTQIWIIKDEAYGFMEACRSYLHLGSGIEVDLRSENSSWVVLSSATGRRFVICPLEQQAPAPIITPGWISQGYGECVAGQVLVWSWQASDTQWLVMGLSDDFEARCELAKARLMSWMS